MKKLSSTQFELTRYVKNYHDRGKGERMEQGEILQEINEILDDAEKKSRVDRIIPLLHGKWELQIMLEICRYDVLRFGEIKRKFPHITNTVLTAALRNLERWDLLSRTQYNEIPPRVEYAPTEKGRSLLPVCYAILQWGLNHGLDELAAECCKDR